MSAASYLTLIDLCHHPSEFAQLHSSLIKLGLIRSPLFSTRLAAACALSSPQSPAKLCLARRLFDLDPNPNSFCFNVLIRSLSQSPQPIEAFSLFSLMLASGGPNAKPNSMTFPFVFKACCSAGAVEEGKQVHGLMFKFEMGSDTFVHNGLINLYAKCGFLDDAVKVFDRMPQRDIVSWNTVIGGFVGLGLMDEARDLFDVMPERNVASWNCLIDGYVKCGSMEIARGLFERMPIKDCISWNIMIGRYASFNNLEEACELFMKMPAELKDLITVKAMIDGYSRDLRFEEVLKLLNEMLVLEIKPDNFTLVSALTACSQLMALEQGEWIHSYIVRYNIRLDAVLGTALLEMYAKCGDIRRALDVFCDMDEKDLSAWNSIISNLGIHGKGNESLEFFSKLLETSIKPDEVTFLSVLSACRHSGLIEEGKRCFSMMSKVYGIEPKAEHLGCMVDLLCRAELLAEANELIEANSGIEFSVAMWGSLLEASSRMGNVEMGKYASKHLLELNPDDAQCYIALSNMYSRGEKWEDSLETRKRMRGSGLEKVPGCSSVEVNGVVHEFSMGSGFNDINQ